MQFRLLGNLEIESGDGRIVPLAPKLRTILSLLLTLNNQTVPVSRLIDELWPDEPPTTVVATIQTYVYQLRKILESRKFAKEKVPSLVTETSGYRLNVLPESIDSHVFERCFREGRLAFEAGDFERSARALHAGLSLWRSSAFADVTMGPRLEAYATQLEEARLQAIELRVDAKTELGQHQEVVRELKALTIAHPLHEGFQAKLMLALYRLGRRHESLDTYARLRTNLVEALGVEPTAATQRLHRALLAADDSVDEFLGAPRASSAAVHVHPAQLPADIPDFTGRTALLARTERLVLDCVDDTATNITVLTGRTGVGKTAFAVRLAHRLKRRFPDGQFYASLTDDNGEPADPRRLLGDFLRSLGFTPEQIPDTLEARSQLFRSWSADRGVLMVLDDALSEREARPLVPGGAHCAVLVSSCQSLPGLSGARVVEVDPLSPNEAVELLGRIVGRRWNDGDLPTLHTIVDKCECLPLALRAIGSRLCAPTHVSLEACAARLVDRHRRLSELRSGDLDLRARLARGRRQLTPATRGCLAPLSRETSTTFTSREAADILRCSTVQAEVALLEASQIRLVLPVGENGDGDMLFRIPDVVRIYFMEESGRGPLPERGGHRGMHVTEGSRSATTSAYWPTRTVGAAT